MCLQRFLVDNWRRCAGCPVAIFTRFTGVRFFRCTSLGTRMLKLSFWACNLVGQAHHAGWLSWAFSNAPWPREMIGLLGALWMSGFFEHEVGWFRPFHEIRKIRAVLYKSEKAAEAASSWGRASRRIFLKIDSWCGYLDIHASCSAAIQTSGWKFFVGRSWPMQPWRTGYKFAGVPAREVSLLSLPMLAPWPANDLLGLDSHAFWCVQRLMSDEYI